MAAQPIPRVLVVEDEPLIRWSLRERLEQQGYRVVEAPTGRAALDCFRQGADLVLLDWKLPDIDGLVVLQRIKHDCPDCPVIMMTAYGGEELDRQARTFGVQRVMDKPFNLDDMLQLVEEALTGAHP